VGNVLEVRRATESEIPVNACGGIGSAADALACLQAGATTVQLYTGLVFAGPTIVGDICSGVGAALRTRRIDLSDLAATP
jgi:dihydroorotate dehydrogenase